MSRRTLIVLEFLSYAVTAACLIGLVVADDFRTQGVFATIVGVSFSIGVRIRHERLED